MKDRKPTLPTPPCVFTSSISQQLLGTVLSRSPGYFQMKNAVYANSIGQNTNGALQIGPMLPGGEGVRRRVRAPLAIAPCVPALWQGPVQGRCAAVAVWRNFYLLSFCLLPLGVSTYTRPRPIHCPTRAPCREAAELTWAVGARPWRRRRRVR